MQIHIYIHCFPQIYGDTLNPLDIQGGVVHPPHEGRFFCNFETGPVIKAFLIFSSQNRTPFQVFPMLQWLSPRQTKFIDEIVPIFDDKYYETVNPPPPSSIHLHPAHFNLYLAPSISTQLISASTQLSATPSTIFQPKYCT